MFSDNQKAAITVDWSKIPTINELEKHLQSVNQKISESSIIFSLKKVDAVSILRHTENQVSNVKNLYEKNGFETKRIIQDPFGHPGPTVSCPIGFPFNLYKRFSELKRYNRWICRLHVDIAQDSNKDVISVPHIEQDPLFHPLSHIKQAFLKGDVVRGSVALEILNFFLDET